MYRFDLCSAGGGHSCEVMTRTVESLTMVAEQGMSCSASQAFTWNLHVAVLVVRQLVSAHTSS